MDRYPPGGYPALLLRTDNKTQSGHDWVVIFAHESEEVVKHFAYLTRVMNAPRGLDIYVARLCSMEKAFPGALVCDDEYNGIK